MELVKPIPSTDGVVAGWLCFPPVPTPLHPTLFGFVFCSWQTEQLEACPHVSFLPKYWTAPPGYLAGIWILDTAVFLSLT